MSKLFTPIQIGGVTLKNRTVMSPMTVVSPNPDGTYSDKQIAYWEARAKGGVGCIIAEMVNVAPDIPYFGESVDMYFNKPEALEKARKFTDTIHKYGTKVFAQISHPGPESIQAYMGIKPMAPSAYTRGDDGLMTRAITLDEIPVIVKQFADTAYTLKETGFDGVQVHCCHAYMLLGSFLSPLRNKRTDRYGGDIFNRARLTLEVIDAIKARCGKDFPVSIRLSGTERDPVGNTLEDMKLIVPEFIRHGIDAVEISGSTAYEGRIDMIPSHETPEGVNVPEAEAIKAVSSVPVFVVGKINNIRRAMGYVDSGRVDGIVMGRALLADPEIVGKAEEGRFDEIAPCTSCQVGCLIPMFTGNPCTCVINPFAGKETEWKIEPAASPKKVAVIGGGIGGMACSRILTLRGHEVTLYEKSDSLGGQLHFAAVAPYKQELTKWTAYLSCELDRLKVPVKYGHEVTVEELKAMDADEIVIATGAEAFIPPVKGLPEKPITALDVLAGKEAVLSGNVLVVGGGEVGVETCLHILHSRSGGLQFKPIQLTIIDMLDKIGTGLIHGNSQSDMKHLRENNVRMMTNTKLISIDGETVHIDCNGEPMKLEGVTSIIFATGTKSVRALYDAFGGSDHVHIIGDALKPRDTLGAVSEGVAVALKI